MKVGQLGEGAGLPGQIAGVTIKRHCLGQAGRGSRVVSHINLQNTQPVERAGLAEPVARLARRGQGGLVEGRLIPMTADGQEAAYRGGDGDRVLEPSVAGGVVGGRVQVRAFSFQPGCCLIESR